MSAHSDTLLAPGTKLAHFEVRRELGSGAMGTVYEAWDTSLDRPVAVKVVRDQVAHDPAIVERFFREARAAARVNHPNLTHIYFVGREGERPYFAMEYVPGATLEKLVADRGPIPLAEAVDLLVQAAKGLAAAHAGAVIHRDVKPSNLIRRDDGVLKVADFGLAKSLGGDIGATGGGSLMGTPTFMSPEQCRGREVDARTDVYALGLVAWFVLTGRPPYESQSLGELLNSQINVPIPSAVAVRPELPPAADAVLARMCAKDPEERPATMDEVVRLLESLRPRTFVPATLFARGAAHFIDWTASTFAGLVVYVLMLGIEKLLGQVKSLLPHWVAVGLGTGIQMVLVLGAMAAVLLVPEVLRQTSVGKYLFDLVVIRADGTRASRMATLGRLALRFPLLVLLPLAWIGPIEDVVLVTAFGVQVVASIAGIVCYLVRRSQTLSDVLTGTRVVYHRDVR